MCVCVCLCFGMGAGWGGLFADCFDLFYVVVSFLLGWGGSGVGGLVG